jgi:hypothetical protein
VGPRPLDHLAREDDARVVARPDPSAAYWEFELSPVAGPSRFFFTEMDLDAGLLPTGLGLVELRARDPASRACGPVRSGRRCGDRDRVGYVVGVP